MIDLGILFKPLTLLINKRIGEQTPARELSEALEGKVMAVRIRDTSLAVYLRVINGKLALSTRYAEDPDVVLTGSPLSLAMLAGSDPQEVIREGHVQLSGDAQLGDRFQQLLRFAQPDLEDELSNVVGDVAAHQAGTVARGLKNAAGDLNDRWHERVGEYLTENREVLPTQAQFADFRSNVERLRDDVARAEARLKMLHAHREESR